MTPATAALRRRCHPGSELLFLLLATSLPGYIWARTQAVANAPARALLRADSTEAHKHEAFHALTAETSQRSNETAKKVKVLYGIESCPGHAYEAMVKAQLHTWARGLPREQLIVVGGPFDDRHHGVIRDEDDEYQCQESQASLACKEGLMLWRASKRVESTGAGWLMVSQDDKYVWREELEEAMKRYDPDTPQVLGSFGCGRAWKNNPDSDGGEKPFPRGWSEPEYSCDDVYEKGGLCGGSTFLVSRAALRQIRRKGQKPADFAKEFATISKSRGGTSDIYTSCLMYDRGVPMMINRLTDGLVNLGDREAAWKKEVPDDINAREAARQFRWELGTTQPLTVHLAGVSKEHAAPVIYALDADARERRRQR